MSRWRLFGIGLAVFILGLIVTAPATLIDAQIEQASSGKLRLAEASGTLWSGTGQIEMLDAFRRNGIAKRITWNLRPFYLLRGKLRYEVNLDRAPRNFPVTITLSGFEIEDADINLPAAALGLGIPKLAALGLSGDMLLHIPRLAISQGKVQGNAVLQWRGAGSTFSQVSPLGDYELRFQGSSSTVQAMLHTLQGPLQLDGEGTWSNGRNPAFSVTALVPPQYRQQLAPLLSMIAIDRGDGSFTAQLN